MLGLRTIHLLIPMSGQGSRFQAAGYTQPKPMIPVNGTPILERLLASFPSSWPRHFVIAEDHVALGMHEFLDQVAPGARVTAIPPHKKGPSYAALEGLKHIPEDDAVFLSYCDYGQSFDAERFAWFVRASDCDICLTAYRGFHAHYSSPVMYAYARLVGDQVVEVREKGSFTSDRETEFASAGGYYFKSAKLLRDGIKAQMRLGLELNGEFYTSLTVEACLRSMPKTKARVFEIPAFYQWGTPSDLEAFEYWERCFAAEAKKDLAAESCAQILMPMAGRGSRFEAVTSVPKPFLRVDGTPMFRAALASLPTAERCVIVALDEHRQHLEPVIPQSKAQVVYLGNTPEGQALSTYRGLEHLVSDRDVIVSSCDHAVVLAGARWREFIANPQCEAAIFTIKGYPLAAAQPNAFAYVVAEDSTDPFPSVRRVSVKKAVSSTPQRDALLVGTFWFKSALLLKKVIEELTAQDIRVRGELYLDSALELLVASGMPVRTIPLDGYINWGDPTALAVALYWQEVFLGRRIDFRPRLPGITDYA